MIMHPRAHEARPERACELQGRRFLSVGMLTTSSPAHRRGHVPRVICRVPQLRRSDINIRKEGMKGDDRDVQSFERGDSEESA